jgi:hypothetical protein
MLFDLHNAFLLFTKQISCSLMLQPGGWNRIFEQMHVCKGTSTFTKRKPPKWKDFLICAKMSSEFVIKKEAFPSCKRGTCLKISGRFFSRNSTIW